MPDREHQSIVEAIEAEPDIAVELAARVMPSELPPYTALDLGNVAVSDVKISTGYADVVVRLKGAGGGTLFAIVVEVQLQDDPAKEWAWPKYWALIRERERAPAMLLVVAGDEATARWARRMPRSSDPHGWRPFVISLPALPRVTDPEEVRQKPARAVLYALARADDQEVVLALMDGLRGTSLPEAEVGYYLDLVLRKAPVGLLEVIMQDEKREYLSEFARKYYGQGKAEGREEGRLQATRQNVRDILTARGVQISAEEAQRIDGCTEFDTLQRWLARAAKANSSADVFVDG